jgi:L-threonylcarbamoyladenylate synthase
MSAGRSSSDVDGPVAAAVTVLRAGGLVAFPTETVYGLGADASNPAAVRHIYEVKGRPLTHPVIVHVASAEAAHAWASPFSDDAEALAAALWPGPLTLVLPRRPHVPDAVTGGLDTVGIRVPDQPLALALLRAFDGGVAAPSANRFGKVSPTTAAHVRADLGDAVDVILDGGPCGVGVESTIVDCTGPVPVLLRPGGTPVETIEAVLGKAIELVPQGPSRAPGMLPSHYAPSCAVELVDRAAIGPRADELRAGGRAVRTVVIEGDLAAEARTLYDRLRQADHDGIDVLLVVPPSDRGLGLAINDRLRKAAAPR